MGGHRDGAFCAFLDSWACVSSAPSAPPSSTPLSLATTSFTSGDYAFTGGNPACDGAEECSDGSGASGISDGGDDMYDCGNLISLTTTGGATVGPTGGQGGANGGPTWANRGQRGPTGAIVGQRLEPGEMQHVDLEAEAAHAATVPAVGLRRHV